MILLRADVLSRWPMPWGPTLRAARHHSLRQIAWFAGDRALHLTLAGLPLRWHVLADRARRSSRPDREALAEWGHRPAAHLLVSAGSEGSDPRSGKMTILGWTRRMLPEAPDWQAPGMPALFTERLHYLAASSAAARSGDIAHLAAVLADHWSRCRPGQGAAWAPFPTARRSIHLLRLWAVLQAAGDVPEVLESELLRHTRAASSLLSLRLERHSHGNHQLTELAALACLGRVWPGPEWVLPRLASETERQFLAGGGHCERSPRYHLDTIQDLIDVLACFGDAVPEAVGTTLRRAIVAGVEFGRWMSHGDGDVALFSDGALSDGHGVEALAGAAESLGLVCPAVGAFCSMPDEGFVVSRRGDTRLIVDCGPVGAPDQPSHGHCDILSFELSDGPRRVVGNRGTAAYSGPGRRASRSTRAHSTVQFGDLEQAEIFGDFRVGQRADPELLEASEDRIRGRFAWPGAAGTHVRTWLPGATAGVLVRVVDETSGSTPPVARFHLPDAVDPVVHGGVRWQVGGVGYELTAPGARVTAHASAWHPQPGASRPAWTVEVRPRGDSVTTTISRARR
jgi:hypothetical protein